MSPDTLAREIRRAGLTTRRIWTGTLLAVGVPAILLATVLAARTSSARYVIDHIPLGIVVGLCVAALGLAAAAGLSWSLTLVYRSSQRRRLLTRISGLPGHEREELLAPLRSDGIPEVSKLAASLARSFSGGQANAGVLSPASALLGLGPELAPTGCSSANIDWHPEGGGAASISRSRTGRRMPLPGFNGWAMAGLAVLCLVVGAGSFVASIMPVTLRINGQRDWGWFNRDYVAPFFTIPPEAQIVRAADRGHGRGNHLVKVLFRMPPGRSPDQWMQRLAEINELSDSHVSQFVYAQTEGLRDDRYLTYKPSSGVYTVTYMNDSPGLWW